MRPNLLRNRQSRRHQKRRPVHRVEPDNFLSHQMQIRRPVTALLILRPAHRAQISRQRIEPHIKYVRLLARHRNAPADRRPRNTQIPQPALHKTQHFIPPRLRLNKLRMLRVKIQKRLLKRRQLKKIVRLRHRFRRPPAIRARFPRLHVHIRIVVNAVLPRVMPRINEPILPAQFKEPLHRMRMLQIRRANKLVALHSQLVPKRLPLRRHLRHKLRLRHPRLLRRPLHIHAVLVLITTSNPRIRLYRRIVSQTIVEYVCPICGNPFV